MATRVQQSSTLLNLPLEIRGLILEMVMCSSSLLEYCVCSHLNNAENLKLFAEEQARSHKHCRKESDTMIPIGADGWLYDPPDVSLLSTCHQLRIEGVPIFYSRNRFGMSLLPGLGISVPYLGRFPLQQTMKASHPFLGLRHVCLNFFSRQERPTEWKSGLLSTTALNRVAEILAQHCHRFSSIEVTIHDAAHFGFHIPDPRIMLYRFGQLRANRITLKGMRYRWARLRADKASLKDIDHIGKLQLVSVIEGDTPRLDLICCAIRLFGLALKIGMRTLSKNWSSRITDLVPWEPGMMEAFVEAMLNWDLDTFEAVGEVLATQLIPHLHSLSSRTDPAGSPKQYQDILDQINSWLDTHKLIFQRYRALAAQKSGGGQDVLDLCLSNQFEDGIFRQTHQAFHYALNRWMLTVGRSFYDNMLDLFQLVWDTYGRPPNHAETRHGVHERHWTS